MFFLKRFTVSKYITFPRKSFFINKDSTKQRSGCAVTEKSLSWWTSKTDSSPNTWFYSLRTFSHNLLYCNEICQYLPISLTSLSKSHLNETSLKIILHSVDVKYLFRGWKMKHVDKRLIEICGQPDDLIPWAGDSLLSESNELIQTEKSWFFSFLQSVSDVRRGSNLSKHHKTNVKSVCSTLFTVSLKSPKGQLQWPWVLAVLDGVWVCVQDSGRVLCRGNCCLCLVCLFWAKETDQANQWETTAHISHE